MKPAAGRRPRVLVVGIGAIGGIVAAKLSAHADVAGFDTNRPHAERISREGLVVEGTSSHHVRFPCASDVAALAQQDVDAIVFLTKSKATGGALDALAPWLEGKPLLVTLQNGMGNAETLSRPGLAVARGVTMDAGRFIEAGRVEHLLHGSTWLGPAQGGQEDIRWFAELLTRSGLPCELIADPMAAVWSKFVFNCVMNPVGALVGGSNAARYEVPEVRALIDDLADECQRVVRALGGSFAFDPLALVHQVRSGGIPRSRHAGSMALDIARGAETEIDELTGYVVAQADRLGIAVPACRTVTRLVKGLEYAARERQSSTPQETRP